MRERFVHLASGSQAGTFIREALLGIGRRERVVALRDPLNVGPLRDVDAGARARVDWWRRVHPKPLRVADVRRMDERPLLERVVAARADVMLWNGPSPIDRLAALRACWYLRRSPDRVFEVVLPPNRSPHLAPFYGTAAIVGPTVLAERWAERARVDDVEERAAEWERLRSNDGDWYRVLEDERIIELPIESLDSELIAACRRRWEDARLGAGRFMAKHLIGYPVVAWRIRELVHRGALEGRGEFAEGGMPAELRLPR